jgi:hypothetical protein
MSTAKRLLKVFVLAAAVITGLALQPGLHPALAAPPSPPFTQCPAVGADPSCKLLIFIDNTGAVVLDNTALGPYDNIEDTLIGVQNNSGITITGFGISGSGIFGFDGDGLCAASISPHPAGCPFGPTGYEGPGTSFTIANVNSGTVSFAGGIASGKSAFFSLEEPLKATSICIPQGKLVYTGATSGHFNDPFTASATLTNSCTGAAISGGSVTFKLDADGSCTATTDATGKASCPVTPSLAAGAYTLTISYAGLAGSILPSSTTTTFTVTLEDSAVTSPTTLQVIAQGGTATLAATLSDPANAAEGESAATPIVGYPVKITLGSGPGSQSCTGTTNASGVATCTISPVTVGLGPQPITDSFVDTTNHYQPASNTQKALVFAFAPGGGAFAIGDPENTPGNSVTFWGAQWWKDNPTSTGTTAPSFKGFVESPAVPSCGATWSADPGNSTPPPAGPLPAFMGIIVTSSYGQSGSTISGNIVHIVVVTTNAGYAPDPGHAGTGTIVATFC